MNERRTERQRAEETNEQEALIGERSFLPLWDRRVGEGKREEGIKINERRQGGETRQAVAISRHERRALMLFDPL